MRRIRKSLIASVIVAASVFAMANPASAAVFNCDVAGLAQLDVDIPITASGPASVAVGESNQFTLDISLDGVIPAEFASLEGNATSAVASIVLPAGIEVDPSTASVSGLDGATVDVSGGKAAVTIPGPIPFGGGASLPSLSITIDVTATQAGEIVLTTEGGSAVLEAEAALTPGSDPIAITATCNATTPENLLVVTASEVASATQLAAPQSTPAATPQAEAGLATTGSESTTLSGVALILLGMGMLAVAGQRVVAYQRD